MADVTISLDSSDVPLIVEALECLKTSLERHDGSGVGRGTQIDLLLNTFKTLDLQPAPLDPES